MNEAQRSAISQGVKAELRALRPEQGHAAYERQKRAWIESNPNASGRDYEAAMTRIARECGV